MVGKRDESDVISQEPRRSRLVRWPGIGLVIGTAATMVIIAVLSQRHSPRVDTIPQPTPNRPVTELSSKPTRISVCDQIQACVAATDDITTRVSRPLRLTRLAPGAACPVSTGVPPPRGWTGDGTAHRIGPVFFLDGRTSDRIARRGLVLFDPRDWTYVQKGWFGFATILLVDPAYHGPILVRARQLDGTHAVGFGWGSVVGSKNAALAHSLKLANGLQDWPGVSWLRSPGCYGWQLDGANFSGLVVLKAIASPAGQ